MRLSDLIRIFIVFLTTVVLTNCGISNTVKIGDDRRELIYLYQALRMAEAKPDPELVEATRQELSSLAKGAADRVKNVSEVKDKIFLYYIATTGARLALDEKAVLVYSMDGETLCNTGQNFSQESAKCFLIVSAPTFAAAELLTYQAEQFSATGQINPEEIKKVLNPMIAILNKAMVNLNKMHGPKFPTLSPVFKETYVDRATDVYCWVAPTTEIYKNNVPAGSPEWNDAENTRADFEASLKKYASKYIPNGKPPDELCPQ
jgi:hypothetical protein